MTTTQHPDAARGAIERRSRALAYAIAAGIGLCAVLWSLPLRVIAGFLPPGAPPQALLDYVQHVTGQVYFLAQPWHWPLLEAQRLDAPYGISIALTDSIPLVAVLLKLLRPLVPWVQQGIGPFLGLAWLMQPVAAVFALRGTGERRLLPAVAIAVMASSMPSFLFRFLHAGLDGHFLLLAALGLYLRAMRPRHATAWLAVLCAVLVLSLFVHPYLMAMIAAIAAAVPASQILRGDFRAAAGGAALVVLATALIGWAAWGFGYLAPGDPNGFGKYSMNLAAPVWPGLGWFAPRLGIGAIEGTGGQYEGYQYLGAGLLGLLLVLFVTRAGRGWVCSALRRHAGLAAAMAVLTLYALSNHAMAFHHTLWQVAFEPPGAHALRSSGRLFWPAAYLLLLAGVRGVCVTQPRLFPVVLGLAALLQLVDAIPLRARVTDTERAGEAAPTPEATRLRGVLAGYRTLWLRPRMECNVWDMTQPMAAILLAAPDDLATDSIYAARTPAGTACDSDLGAADRLLPGVLGLAYGERRDALAHVWQAYGARCGVLGEDVLCSADGQGLAGLPQPPVPPPLPPGVTVSGAQGERFGASLVHGWYQLEPWGAWAGSPFPQLRIVLPDALRDGPVAVTLGLQAPPGGVPRPVVVHAGAADGPVVARFSVAPDMATYRLVVPADLGRQGDLLALTLDDGATVRIPTDARHFGVGLGSIRIEPAP